MGQPVSFATSYMVCREEKRTNNSTILLALKNNEPAGYQCPVEIVLLKGADLLKVLGRRYGALWAHSHGKLILKTIVSKYKLMCVNASTAAEGATRPTSHCVNRKQSV